MSRALKEQPVFDAFRKEWIGQLDRVATRDSVIRIFSRVAKEVQGCTFVLDGLDECVATDSTASSSPIAAFLEAIWKATEGS